MFKWDIAVAPQYHGSPLALVLHRADTGEKVFEAVFDTTPGTLDEIEAQLGEVIAYARRRMLAGRKD